MKRKRQHRMSKLPKLKVKMPSGNEEIHEFEESKSSFPNWAIQGILVLIEGQERQVVKSYEELVNMVAQNQYKDREFLEMVLLPFIDGG